MAPAPNTCSDPATEEATGRLVLIDLPQIVDVVANPQGPDFLARDVKVVATWFAARGMSAQQADAQALTRDLLAEAGLR